MHSLDALSLLLLATAATVAAVPTATTWENATKTDSLTGVTHSVVAGLGGLRFDPDNVVAEIGDIVEWHFLPKNHSVAQSNFAKPCEPLADRTSFFAGFNFVTQANQAANVFQIVVAHKNPTWYYCPQQTGSHCQNGMVGVVNQNFDDPAFSLAQHRALAANTHVSIVPPVEQGGSVIANPNPLGGF
ncbi:hypothetical protein G6O67_004241 [Ophiocordyceps sinensis]|uniref:Extracellular serine-rich protein n=2 Tax=Ophiocordyceps sinensis TaxID=72228 RepID=A0A8H4LYG9_9HYPO|nr:plastocyanin-like domain-containing protein [Ophiocordyceps sinensis CO18]KAF4507778.1 hypothetical protein G6O67_004241 [Ophiocordyceps sinensis]